MTRGSQLEISDPKARATPMRQTPTSPKARLIALELMRHPFIRGAGSLLDLAGSNRITVDTIRTPSPDQDRINLLRDGRACADDLNAAIEHTMKKNSRMKQ